mmetsp:Transcript_36454/g.67384  ORF Transcript_36454/g.67384 Transcript_36454/m.67384 type:complete len:107 (-) Transcript_36454:28-348(-)
MRIHLDPPVELLLLPNEERCDALRINLPGLVSSSVKRAIKLRRRLDDLATPLAGMSEHDDLLPPLGHPFSETSAQFVPFADLLAETPFSSEFPIDEYKVLLQVLRI